MHNVGHLVEVLDKQPCKITTVITSLFVCIFSFAIYSLYCSLSEYRR